MKDETTVKEADYNWQDNVINDVRRAYKFIDREQANWAGPNEFCYLIQDKNKGPIKIGVATNPVTRLSQIQTCYPYRLRIILIFKIPPGESLSARCIESYLHLWLKEYRLIGEWFQPEVFDILMSDIKLCSISPPPLPTYWIGEGFKFEEISQPQLKPIL